MLTSRCLPHINRTLEHIVLKTRVANSHSFTYKPSITVVISNRRVQTSAASRRASVRTTTTTTTTTKKPHAIFKESLIVTIPNITDSNLARTVSSSSMASATTFYDFTPKDKKERDYPLSQHKGKVVLMVNTASKCGFTPQFTGLEDLWKKISAKYPDQFVMLGVPCNQFGGQDPGSDDQIQEFCQVNYGVTFPVLGKTDVNGEKAEPVFEWMKAEKPGFMGLKRIKWNFEKFLIGKDGKVVQRWASLTKPETLEKDIIKEIEKTTSAKSEL